MRYQALLLDLSGVLYIDQSALPGAVAAIARLQRSPLALRFITNSSRQSAARLLAHLQGLGFAIRPEQLFTAAGATLTYLRAHQLKVYALVHPALDAEFAPLVGDPPDAVVIGDAAERFDYARLNRAFQYLMAGAELIALGDNRYFRSQGALQLDAGAFVHALSYAAETRARVLGKPAAGFFHQVLDSIPCAPNQALMVGDDWQADVEAAQNAGLDALLVQTGKYRAGDEHRPKRKPRLLPGLSDLPDWLGLA